MKTENIVEDRNYGKILYEIAKKEAQISAIHEELLALRDVYKKDPQIGETVADDRFYKERGIVIADVTSVVSLTEEENERLKAEIKEITGANKVIIREQLDSSILGGLIVQVGHKMIDNSVKKQLKEMHKELLA